jgi:metacaspase-1
MAKKALLIGINRYRVPGADLRGCVNDLKNLRGVLEKYYGFPQRGIKVLADSAATQARMQREIRKLIGRAKRGDVLVIHYSGHGSNVPDKNGDEADLRDEILCPCDLDWKNPFADDWLRKEFDKLPSGVNLTVIMDCCHSGTNTRAILPRDAPRLERFLPCPLDLMAVESGRGLKGAVRKTLTRGSTAKRKGDIVDVSIPELLITGCRSTQTSADAYIGGSYNGALTYHLMAAIKAKKGKISYRELHSGATQLLKRRRFDQVPQLEGHRLNFDLPFLEPIA